jgi:hypothetical protein
MENVELFSCHWVYYIILLYFTSFTYITWPLGIFYGHKVYFPRFGMLYQEKSGNSGL